MGTKYYIKKTSIKSVETIYIIFYQDQLSNRKNLSKLDLKIWFDQYNFIKK